MCTCSGGQSNNILHAGDYFGERALLMREPRVADVLAESDVTLVAIDREDFEKLLGHVRDVLEHNGGMRLLLCVPLLAHLSNDEVRLPLGCVHLCWLSPLFTRALARVCCPSQRSRLLERLSLVSFDAGAPIIRQGMQVGSFYIVKDGSVEARWRSCSPPRPPHVHVRTTRGVRGSLCF